jgi:uncharacterized protein
MNDQEYPCRDRVLFLLKDPHWTFIWWDLTPETWERALSDLGPEAKRARLTLRVHDVTGSVLDAGDPRCFFDIDVIGLTDHWYLDIWVCDRSYRVEVGLKTEAGDFHALARSNTLDLPRDRPSDSSDEAWGAFQLDGAEG